MEGQQTKQLSETHTSKYRKKQTKHSCVFGLCVRNNEKGLPKVFENLSKIRGLFDKTMIIVYYDESKDNSLELVKSLSIKYNFMSVILNADCGVKPSGPRTFNIARARNAIVDFVNKRCDEYDMFAMMDSNDYSCQGDIKPEVIKKYLNNDDNENDKFNEWDALSFLREPYYDLWAYSDGRFQLGCWTYPRILNNMEKNNNLFTVYEYQKEIVKYINETINAEENKGKLIEVDSAFCGFALYKKKAFEGCFYNGKWTTTYMDKEKLEENLRLYKLANKTEYYENYRNMEDCEHRHFHMMAKKKNNAKIMVACDAAFTYF